MSNPTLNKNNNLKKITRGMYSWNKSQICEGLLVFKKEGNGVGGILVSIPKRVVKSSVKRNRLRRVVKEVYRKCGGSSLGSYFLIKFNSGQDGFKKNLESYFEND